MPLTFDTSSPTKYTKWSVWLVIIVILTGLLVLGGWIFDIALLKKPFPRLVVMNPVTALAFIFSGVSFLLLSTGRMNNRKLMTGYFFATLVSLIGVAKLMALVTHANWQIDEVLFTKEQIKEITSNVSYHMAPNTALCFVLSGIALLLLNYETPRKRVPSHYISITIALLGLLTLLGYLYQVKESYGVLAYMHMAVPTATCFILLSTAILFRNANKGLMNEFTGPWSGNFTARLLVPFAIIIPVVLGFLRLWAAWAGIFPLEMGTVVLVLTIIVIFLILTWFIAISLNKKDKLNRQFENSLQQSEAQIQNIFNAAPDAVIVIDQTGHIIKWNPMAEALFGWRGTDVIGTPLSETIIPHRYRDAHRKGLERFLQTGEATVSGKTIEIQAINKSNLEFDVSLSISPTVINDEYLFIGFIRDITQQKKAVEQLKESEHKFQKAFQASAAGISITRLSDSTYMEVNDTFSKMVGFSIEELLGRTSVEMGFVVDIPRREEVLAQVRKEGFIKNFEMTVRSKSGRILEVLSSVETILLKGEKYAINIIYDITDRKRAERQLEAVNKELEAFSYSVSHDLRAPLRIVDGYTSILMSDYSDKLDAEGNRMLQIITENAKRMGTLIDDLLNLSRLGRRELNFFPVNMNRLVESVINEMEMVRSTPYKITTTPLEQVRCDESLIRQVWVNLISNAIKYSGKMDDPQIEIKCSKTIDEMIYSVKDNGVGFDMQYSDKLFGVFQRLHKMNEFEGTGVGLALVHRIITRHGGRVWAEGQPGKGATFYFSLPIFFKNHFKK